MLSAYNFKHRNDPWHAGDLHNSGIVFSSPMTVTWITKCMHDSGKRMWPVNALAREKPQKVELIVLPSSPFHTLADYHGRNEIKT